MLKESTFSENSSNLKILNAFRVIDLFYCYELLNGTYRLVGDN